MDTRSCAIKKQNKSIKNIKTYHISRESFSLASLYSYHLLHYSSLHSFLSAIFLLWMDDTVSSNEWNDEESFVILKILDILKKSRSSRILLFQRTWTPRHSLSSVSAVYSVQLLCVAMCCVLCVLCVCLFVCLLVF